MMLLTLHELGDSKQHAIAHYHLRITFAINCWILWPLGKHTEGVSIRYILVRTATLLPAITLEYKLD